MLKHGRLPEVATYTRKRRNEEENEKKNERTSARLTNRDDPLKHRRVLDYEAPRRTSRCYEEFVRKLGLEKRPNLNEMPIEAGDKRVFSSLVLVRN
jgi:hypothetical protein